MRSVARSALGRSSQLCLAGCWDTAKSVATAKNRNIIEPNLQQITVFGHQVKLISPEDAFQCLGIQVTLSLNWNPQFEAVQQLIITQGERILTSDATMQQEWETEEQSIFSSLQYGFCVKPCTPHPVESVGEPSLSPSK